MSKSTNLGLNLFEKLVDPDQSFEEYQLNLSGNSNSNMTIIDTAFGLYPSLIALLATNSSASSTTVSGSLNNISGSVSDIETDIAELQTRFVRIGEHSGSGQADFTGISGSYTHILILGFASGGPSGSFANVGIDFNGDSNTANYVFSQAHNSGSYYNSGSFTENYAAEAIDYVTNRGQIVLAKTDGDQTPGFTGAFLGFIPNYSSSGSLYKSAMGFSVFMGELFDANPPSTAGHLSVSFQGGQWNSSGSINRIRVFAGSANSTRYDFTAGTKITLFGIY